MLTGNPDRGSRDDSFVVGNGLIAATAHDSRVRDLHGHPCPTVVDTVALATDSPWCFVEIQSAPTDGPAPLLADRVRTHLALLDHHDLDTASGATLVSDLQLIDQIESYLHAAKVRRLALLTRPGTAGDPTALVERRLAENPMLAGLSPEQVQIVRDGETVLAAEQLAVAQVGATMAVAPGTAARRIHEALDLAENLPVTLIALADGSLDHQRAKILADRSRVLTADQRRELERRLLERAASCTPRQWRNLVESEVIAIDPDAADARHRDAVDRRKLRLDKLDDGIGRFLADLPAHQAQLAWDLFDAVAEALRGLDDRTVDQRRADAFITIVEMLASGQSVTVADILAHPDLTRHDTCLRPPHPADLVDEPPATAHPCSDCASATPSPESTHDAEPSAPQPCRTGADNRSQGHTDRGEPGPSESVELHGRSSADQQHHADRGGSEPSESVEVHGQTSADQQHDAADSTAQPSADGLGTADGRSTTAGSTSSPADNGADGSGADAEEHRPADSGDGTAPVEPPPPSKDSSARSEPLFGMPTTTPSGSPDSRELLEISHTRAACQCGHWKLPTRQGRDTHTTVVITLAALAGLSQDPAALAGHGTITAEYARALADSARSVGLLVVDEAGKVIGIGDRKYRPTQRLRDRVTTAYPTCVFTGCHRQVDRSELDHIDPFDHDDPNLGGRTEFGNLGALCRHHHRLKTLGGWTYQPARSVGNPLRGGSSIPAAYVFRSPLGLKSLSRVDHVVRPRHETPAPF